MKFVCTHGHLHNEQWRADNCAACKRNARAMLRRRLGGSLFKALFGKAKTGAPLPNSRDRAVRRRLIVKAVR